MENKMNNIKANQERQLSKMEKDELLNIITMNNSLWLIAEKSYRLGAHNVASK